MKNIVFDRQVYRHGALPEEVSKTPCLRLQADFVGLKVFSLSNFQVIPMQVLYLSQVYSFNIAPILITNIIYYKIELFKYIRNCGMTQKHLIGLKDTYSMSICRS